MSIYETTVRTNFREDRVSQLVSQFASKPASCPEEIVSGKLVHQSLQSKRNVEKKIT